MKRHGFALAGMTLLTAHALAHAQNPADTVGLARGTAAAVASNAFPPQIRADTVILEPDSRWEMLLMDELEIRLGDTEAGRDGPHWMRFRSGDLSIARDSAVVSVEVHICSRDRGWREPEVGPHEHGRPVPRPGRPEEQTR